MSNLMNSIHTLVTTWRPLVYILVAVSLLVIGVMFVVPSQEVKQKATRALPWVIIGCGVALLATTIAQEISNAFNVAG